MQSRILVVDDDAGVRELLAEYLRGRGMEVDVADDGATAFALMAVRRPDALVTDLKLPDVDGRELIEEVRRDEPVAVVATTGYGTVEGALGALKAGATDLLLKPFKLRDLYAALQAAMERADREREARRAAAALALLERAVLASTEVEADALVEDLAALWPELAGLDAPFSVAGPGEGYPLGATRSLLSPPPTCALPYVMAVRQALERCGR